MIDEGEEVDGRKGIGNSSVRGRMKKGWMVVGEEDVQKREKMVKWRNE